MADKKKGKEPRIIKLIAQIGGVAVAVSAIVGLLFLLVPELKPEPPQKLDATLSNLVVERGVTLESYLKRQSIDSTQYTHEELQTVGVVISFNVKIEGFKGRSCLLKWSLYEDKTQARVPEGWLVDKEFREFTPEAEVDQAGSDIWVQVPNREGPFFARLELYDDKGVRITFTDSPIFPGVP